jgi:hypothetical protein
MQELPALHFGGASTYTAAFMTGVVFLLIFVVSFALGPLPAGGRRFGRRWIEAWLKASMPRLVVAGVFSAGLFAASSLSGGGRSGSSAVNPAACETPLPAFTSNPVTGERLEAAVEAMRRVADAAAIADTALAQSLFFTGDTHAVTHDIDAPLRNADLALAKQICASVLVLEAELPGAGNLEAIEREARRTAGLLDRAGDAMGLTQ